MALFGSRLRRFVMRAAVACATTFPLSPPTQAQWFLPFGAAQPAEIVNRLRAEGYVLARPLERRDTVYLADVAHGPRGRERLVIDAWSGEILQRFVARRGRFIPEGGEFSEPPPLGPPPAQDFREGNYDHPAGSEQPKAKARQRPATTARKSGEPKPTAPTASPAAAPSTAAPGAPAPATAATPSILPSNPNTAAQPPPAPTEAKETIAPGRPPAAERPGEKKVNDVPVNPLD